MFPANEISVFFNNQYLINGLTSDFDFWNVEIDMNEKNKVY